MTTTISEIMKKKMPETDVALMTEGYKWDWDWKEISGHCYAKSIFGASSPMTMMTMALAKA